MTWDPVREIERMSARARTAGRQPRRVRIHPMDLAMIPTIKDDPVRGMGITRLVGIPVVPDCAVKRGDPKVEYDDD